MTPLLLTPQDTLSFRDARPMSGSLAGHGAAWPAPHAIHQAFHAAFHRAALASHAHNEGSHRTRDYSDATRVKKYGSLKTIGPFPVSPEGAWLAPAPLDCDATGAIAVRLIETNTAAAGASSLPAPLTHAVAGTRPPSKEKLPEWAPLFASPAFAPPALSKSSAAPTASVHGRFSREIFDAEPRVGIGIDAGAGAQDGNRFYTAEIMRLRTGWKIGVLAECEDKEHGDLLAEFLKRENTLVLGGQQGVCKITRAPNPVETPPFTPDAGAGAGAGKTILRWQLLSPAIFPALPANPESGKTTADPGGWLPNWIHPATGAVLLPAKIERRAGESRADWRKRVTTAPPLHAKLMAALTGKPAAVTGWDLAAGAPRQALQAVPAGSVYYFECAGAEAASRLAATLHFTPRSTLLGEKGHGIGLCAEWRPATNPTQQ